MNIKSILVVGVLFLGFGQSIAGADLAVKDCKFKTVNIGGERWGELRVKYITKTKVKWLDKLTLDFYVATKPDARLSGIAEPKWTMFHKQVDYVDVLDGNKEAVTYLHFNTVKRYVPAAAKVKFAVIFKYGGEVISIVDSEKKPDSKWWESDQFLQKSGYLMSRDESPFDAINTDVYEMIEPKGR